MVVNNEHNVEICWKMIHLHRNRDIKRSMLLESFWDFLLYNCWVNLSNKTNTVVRYNEPCKDECLGRGYSYFWCNTLDNSWDYCSPKGDLNNFGKKEIFPEIDLHSVVDTKPVIATGGRPCVGMFVLFSFLIYYPDTFLAK